MEIVRESGLSCRQGAQEIPNSVFHVDGQVCRMRLCTVVQQNTL
jgi:hypothetical protein